jgi:Ca-activated chloride channel family protein
MLLPPRTLENLPRKPLEMVFTIDVSGSQSGAPLAQEKAAVSYALLHMGPEDTFQIVRFGDAATRLFPQPAPADEANVHRALAYVDALDAHEGTMLVDGVRASLLFAHDPDRLRVVAFLTDGFIGNESEALAEIHHDLGPSRIFSIGVGSSTNRYLLDRMALMGDGAAAYLGLHDDAAAVMAEFFGHISHPALTDITVDWGGMKVAEVYPSRISDLFVGRPVILTGRFEGSLPTDRPITVRVHGKAGNEDRTIVIPINASDVLPHAGIASVWARQKIASLADRATYESDDSIQTQIRRTALEYGLLSDYTAFIALDATRKTAGESGTTVAVPVPAPEGVRYDTTVEK